MQRSNISLPMLPSEAKHQCIHTKITATIDMACNITHAYEIGTFTRDLPE